MAGLCEGGNEPSGSLKAICKAKTMLILRHSLSIGMEKVLESVLHPNGQEPEIAEQEADLQQLHCTCTSIWGEILVAHQETGVTIRKMPKENGKKILGISLKDRIRNEEVRRRSGVEDVVTIANRTKWRWEDTWYECILPDGHTRRHCGIQELAEETVDDREPDGGRVQVAARRTVDQNRTPKNTVEGRSQPTLSGSNNQC
ncbi:hypothetical protein ANN_26526 [Periplaneta americana]|uniref:Uncharacterized protein n=1 Tax=Periplaneta americana TaxID=6978 RepID=A0ABQ8RYI7_PERAM|nr:hypothetical protein ANN_26526 [Periplaneta americana]